VHGEVFALLEQWRDILEEVPVTLPFDVAALRARQRAHDERLAFLEHELGVARDAAAVVDRFASLSEILAFDDVRDAATAPPVTAWEPDGLWPFPTGVEPAPGSVLHGELEDPRHPGFDPGAECRRARRAQRRG